MRKKIFTPDFCVVGGGSGGLSFASGAAQMGAQVLLLEETKMGGDCLNYGCVPSKALIAAARFKHEFSHSEKFGWFKYSPKVDFQGVHRHIRQAIARIAPNDSVERFTQLGVQVVLERGYFVDTSTVETASYSIKAKRFIIATGSSPSVPPIPGLSEALFFTNESIFDLTVLPTHLVVIGGGPIGIEIAQAFLGLGSEVTVLEAFTTLPKDDPEATEVLKEILRAEGMTIHENVKILSVHAEESGAGTAIIFQTKEGQELKLCGSHILVATGRHPNLAPLNLEAAGVRFSPKGIEVNAQLRTSNKKVYAIGDCTGGYQFTHVAGYHAGLALRNTIFGLRARVNTLAIPWVTYTNPELAHVGALESQLKQQKIPHKILKLTFQENDRAQIEQRTEGLLKILVTPKGHVLGATILGLQAGELIFPWVLAIQNRFKLSTFANTLVPYPTLNELNKRVAGSFYTNKIFSPFMKKILGFLLKRL